MMYNVTSYINELNEYAEYKLDLYLEGKEFKIPKIKAKIVDKIVPKNVEVRVISGNGACISKGHIFNIKPKDANYTVIVEYDTKSSLINITTITNINKYNYTLTYGEREGKLVSMPIHIDNYINVFKCENITKKIEKDITVEVESKDIVENQIINR